MLFKHSVLFDRQLSVYVDCFEIKLSGIFAVAVWYVHHFLVVLLCSQKSLHHFHLKLVAFNFAPSHLPLHYSKTPSETLQGPLLRHQNAITSYTRNQQNFRM